MIENLGYEVTIHETEVVHSQQNIKKHTQSKGKIAFIAVLHLKVTDRPSVWSLSKNFHLTASDGPSTGLTRYFLGGNQIALKM